MVNRVYSAADAYRNKIYYYPVLEDCKDVPFDMRRVHPVQQRTVYRLYQLLKGSSIVIKAWIFGSTISWSWNSDSDTDICISTIFDANVNNTELDTLYDAIREACNYEPCDIVRLETCPIGGTLRDTINYEGLQIL